MSDFAVHAAGLRRAPLRAVHAWHVPLGLGGADAGERARIRQEAEQRLAERACWWWAAAGGVPRSARTQARSPMP
ncbi:hypothetical protein RFN57_40085 [Streptomyces violaceochromogenes]|uniref:Uncharacterized protein n=1 Tax=Streptomyces violaceochromogenes TaxID=67377 RepID=A0ABU6M9E5_9ACTN|nr:hypothetical protein [Streptomyces violaceochromogenes]MEC7058442.1 hypothetical protein [Streptomyces violaceochromogenes]